MIVGHFCKHCTAISEELRRKLIFLKDQKSKEKNLRMVVANATGQTVFVLWVSLRRQRMALHLLQCLPTPCRQAILCRAVQCQATPCRTPLYQATPCQGALCKPFNVITDWLSSCLEWVSLKIVKNCAWPCISFSKCQNFHLHTQQRSWLGYAPLTCTKEVCLDLSL